MTSLESRDTAGGPPLLEVEDLRVEFDTYGGSVKAVRGVSFSVEAGKTLAIVGESGCGKSVTVQSLMGLTPMPPGRLTSGRARLRGVDILGRTEIDGREIRGREIGMIFQDPMTSLNPTMTIGRQIAETLEVHRGWSRKRALDRAVELLDMARIPEAAQRANQYPFEFSGGMLQRAMIAMAIACEPAILIADEPTTALDVTIQAQVLDLLADLQRDNGTAIILITHDLGVVARMADEVVVMYAGQVAERGGVELRLRPTEDVEGENAKQDPERGHADRDLREHVAGLGAERALAPRATEGSRQPASTPPLDEHEENQEQRREDEEQAEEEANDHGGGFRDVRKGGTR
jgi:ABC-type dipeptide/oligopeptide/nickel transport system ATPase component